MRLRICNAGSAATCGVNAHKSKRKRRRSCVPDSSVDQLGVVLNEGPYLTTPYQEQDTINRYHLGASWSRSSMIPRLTTCILAAASPQRKASPYTWNQFRWADWRVTGRPDADSPVSHAGVYRPSVPKT